jgi:coenzyme Q-binding protein COQ10
MISFKTEKKVDFSSTQIFELIMDIEKYPEFLEWIIDGRIISKKDNYIIAELTASFKGYKTSYISNITTEFSNNNYKILINSDNGPFEILRNIYVISEIDKNSCLISLDNAFEFRIKILDRLISKIFEDKAQKIISSFEDRAKKIYIK